jgi:hypothetical protein
LLYFFIFCAVIILNSAAGVLEDASSASFVALKGTGASADAFSRWKEALCNNLLGLAKAKELDFF